MDKMVKGSMEQTLAKISLVPKAKAKANHLRMKNLLPKTSLTSISNVPVHKLVNCHFEQLVNKAKIIRLVMKPDTASTT